MMMTVSPASGGKGIKTPERPLHAYMAEVSERTEVRSGVPLPLGTHESEGGLNFALFIRHASRVRLELFDQLMPVLNMHHGVHTYKPGSWGPKQADALIATDGCWHNPTLERASHDGA
ncbi:hypothetical protein [Thiobacillus sp.]|jgi:hypothetical protein|uniref:hypothetical protein n=1 Tax=Thiobacillus sp. TaxID=924 RepID=UPI0025E52332|nr:hypothetical protein [Thiobacillus sp.]